MRTRAVAATARLGWNALGIAVFVVLVFPVYWMVSTAFKPDSGIISREADVGPAAPDARRTSRTRCASRTSGRT